MTADRRFKVRTVQTVNPTRLFAGCSIVAGTELAEAEARFQPMLQALGSFPDQAAGTGP